MNKESSKGKMLRKMLGAAALVIVFAGVISAVPDHQLAWQGPLVMGTLSMPTPNPSHILLRDPRPNSDSMFSLLGFISVMGILALGGRWFFGKPSPGKVHEKTVPPLVFP